MTFTLAQDFVSVNCGHGDGGCGVEFAMTRDFYLMTKAEGRYWYCPNGHRRVWGGKTTVVELEESRARETALQDQLAAAVRDAEATRAALIRDRHRFANGVCPSCNRYFANVHRHVTSQHPDYDVTQVKQHGPTRYRCSCGRSFDTPRGLAIHQGHNRRAGWDQPDASRWSAHLTAVGRR